MKEIAVILVISLLLAGCQSNNAVNKDLSMVKCHEIDTLTDKEFEQVIDSSFKFTKLRLEEKFDMKFNDFESLIRVKYGLGVLSSLYDWSNDRVFNYCDRNGNDYFEDGLYKGYSDMFSYIQMRIAFDDGWKPKDGYIPPSIEQFLKM